jgi:hypothetical protein
MRRGSAGVQKVGALQAAAFPGQRTIVFVMEEVL